MNNLADLHIHTYYSDGKLSPEQVLKKALKEGLSAFSITDHDTIRGCLIMEKLLEYEYRIDFIPGIEFSCYDKDREVHMLGYNLDLNNHDLQTYIKELQIIRYDRAKEIIDNLKKQNVHIEIEEVEQIAGQAPIVRPHIATALINNKYSGSFREAFYRYIGDSAEAYVPKKTFSVSECVELVRNAGGVTVLAHPANYFDTDTILSYINSGIDGLEVIHPLNSKEVRRNLHRLAQKFELLETGGSDYHGSRVNDESNFGAYLVPLSVVEKIKERSVKRQRA